MVTDRRLYQRLKSREYRARERAKNPPVILAKASPTGYIHLKKAGVIPGETYRATVQPDGGIHLEHQQEKNQ